MDDKEITMDQQRVTIVNIATNHYVHYLFQFIDSIPRRQVSTSSMRLLIFTDEPQLVNEKLGERKDLLTEVVEIESFGWPEATLFRYELISRGSYLEDEIIAYVDVDSLVLLPQLISKLLLEKEKVSLVRHPGYAWPQISAFFRNPMRSLRRVVFLLTNRIHENGFGTWETDPSSLAYVEPQKRSLYFCGGFWWGPKNQILAMCDQLADRINQDYEKGKVARWHDESHLNWFAANNSRLISINPSKVCFSPSISVTSRKHGWIEAVDK